MDEIKILVADNQPMMREALITALEDEADLQVVAYANRRGGKLMVE